ncbi:MAG TPA: hypothetical protein VMM13_17965, partial [Euzebya sp.]|nr:hypothetical protein [Euzebya sp.]
MTPVCTTCGATFDVPADKAARFPGWTPRECPRCWRARRPGGGGAQTGARSPSGGRGRSSSLVEDNLTTAEVLARHT